MLKKIISGGQTGADRAALDLALKFNIEHGGWMPKGRKTEDGPLPVKYHLTEMATTDYRERTKQNIVDSHGTLIISRGELTGGSKLTQTHAKIMGRPNCFINLVETEDFEAAIIIKSFIIENQIQILNVAGPRLSHHPWIYKDVKTVLEAALYLMFLDTRMDIVLKKYIPVLPFKEDFPETLENSIDLFCDDFSLKTKTFIAKFEMDDIHMLYFSFLEYVRHRVGFDTENKKLLKDCCTVGDDGFTIEDAVMVIIKQFKLSFETSHLLRIVK